MVSIYFFTIVCALIFSGLGFFLLHRYGQELKSKLYGFLDRNFYFLRDYHIEYWLINISVVIFFIAYYITQKVIYAVLLNTLSLICFYFLLEFINNYIERKIEQEIPSFLRLLAASLQAGQSLHSALKDTIQSCQGPLKKEMNFVLRELQVGLSLQQALTHLRQRMPTPSVNMMTLSLEVAFNSGASIAELLHELASSIQQKIELQYKIQALSLQGRLQAYVLTAVPYVLLALLYWVDASWIMPFTQTLAGNIVLAFCVLMSITGFYFIKKIVDIKI